MIRPEHIPMSWNKEELRSSDVNVFEGTIVSETFTGKLVDCRVRVGEFTFEVQTPLRHTLEEENRVFLYLPPERCVMLPKDAPGAS
jgi:ABC-type Fe3+/spermidine/putrescine transport system ATPase subunit